MAKKVKNPHGTLTFRPRKKNQTLLVEMAKLAEKDNRKLNNYIETLFINHLRENGVTNFEVPEPDGQSQ